MPAAVKMLIRAGIGLIWVGNGTRDDFGDATWRTDVKLGLTVWIATEGEALSEDETTVSAKMEKNVATDKVPQWGSCKL